MKSLHTNILKLMNQIIDKIQNSLLTKQ